MHGSPLRRTAILLVGGATLVAIGGTVAACGPATSDISVTGAIVPVPATADTAAVYLTITNDGDLDDRLESVSSSAAAGAHLHETEIDDEGRATMRAVGRLSIPGGTTVVLKPGGLHLMLMQPQPLADGDTLELSLRFRHAGTKRVTARVTDDIDDVVAP